MSLWLSFFWSKLRWFAICLEVDAGRMLGFPCYGDVDPRRSIVAQALEKEVEQIYLDTKLDGWKPKDGSWAGLKTILSTITSAHFHNRRVRRRLSKATGIRFRSNQQVKDFYRFLDRQEQETAGEK